MLLDCQNLLQDPPPPRPLPHNYQLQSHLSASRNLRHHRLRCQHLHLDLVLGVAVLFLVSQAMRPHQVRLRSERLRHLRLAVLVVLVAESEVVLARLFRNHSQSRHLLAALGVLVPEQADQGVAVV